MSTEETSDSVTRERPPSEPRDTVYAVSAWLRGLSDAERRQIERNPEMPSGCFWRMTHEVLEPRGAFASGDIKTTEHRWAVIASAMAAMVSANLIRQGLRPGQVLATFLKEDRFIRLVHRNGRQLEVLLRTTVKHAISKKAGFDFADLAELILTDGTPNQRNPRIRLSRDFYRAANR